MALDKETIYSRKYESSPIFSAVNQSTIGANGNWVFNWDDQSGVSRKYLPFDNVAIANNSNSVIIFYPNQSQQQIPILPGTIRSFGKGAIPALRGFKIDELSGSSIGGGQLQITAYREAITPESMLQKAHRWFFK